MSFVDENLGKCRKDNNSIMQADLEEHRAADIDRLKAHKYSETHPDVLEHKDLKEEEFNRLLDTISKETKLDD